MVEEEIIISVEDLDEEQDTHIVKVEGTRVVPRQIIIITKVVIIPMKLNLYHTIVGSNKPSHMIL